MERYNLISFLGIFILLLVAWAFSANRRNMNFRLIGWGIGLQLVIGLFVFVVPQGRELFLFLNDAAIKLLEPAQAGARFVFGRLALAPGQINEAGESSLGFILAFQAFPTIIFFSALISILYFCNIMPRIIRAFAWLFTRLMRISGAESLVAASNIFVGVESVLTVKPHLKDLTRSELCTILCAGMATVASNVLALYIFTLKEQFPTIAGHLISASLLSAPAALVVSKIILPEDEIPLTRGERIPPAAREEDNLFEAVINGANNAVKMIVGIVSLLIAVLGLVALLDLVIGIPGAKLNALWGSQLDWSLKGLLAYLFYPLTLIVGVPFSDAGVVSGIIAERLVVTEVVSYQHLNAALAQGTLTHPRSAVICAYALCGFAHVASMAIFAGGVAALAPGQRRLIARVAPRALLAATLACLLTAAVAGTFFTQSSVILP